jgi:hypothetical protein
MSDGKTVRVKATISWHVVLGIALVVLKLAGVIGWSWWLVLAPFWISPALVVVFFVPLLVYHLVRGK